MGHQSPFWREGLNEANGDLACGLGFLYPLHLQLLAISRMVISCIAWHLIARPGKYFTARLKSKGACASSASAWGPGFVHQSLSSAACQSRPPGLLLLRSPPR